jgi:hypothetical protein
MLTLHYYIYTHNCEPLQEEPNKYISHAESISQGPSCVTNGRAFWVIDVDPVPVGLNRNSFPAVSPGVRPHE